MKDYNIDDKIRTSRITNHKINKAMDIDDSKHGQDSDVEVEGEGFTLI